MSDMREHFYILGCQRTGTTLMRLILETHPDVFCYDELKGYAVLQKSIPEDLTPARLIGFKIPRWTEQLSYQILLDDGPEGPCDNFYRGEKILFLLRDVRDTIASMLKLKGGESNWCEEWAPRIIDAKFAQDETFRARYSVECNVIENCSNRLIGLAALYWKYKTESFFLYRSEGLPVLPVSYERLVTEPRALLPLVCAHLGIRFHENLMHHNEFRHAELFENGMTLGNTDPTRPIQFDSVEQWVRYLSNDDLELIWQIVGDLPARVTALFETSPTPHGDPIGIRHLGPACSSAR
jgi:hypothetical protein